MAISQETLNLFEDDIQEFKKEEYFRSLPPIERDPKVVETPAELIKDTEFAKKKYGPVEKFLNSSWRAIAGGAQDFAENLSLQSYKLGALSPLSDKLSNTFREDPTEANTVGAVKNFAEYQVKFLEDKDGPNAEKCVMMHLIF